MKEKLRMKNIFGEYCICGEKAPFKDSNGDNLYTGDVVILFDKDGNSKNKHPIVKYENKIFVMGIESSCPNYEKDEWKIYKEKSYMSMKNGNEIGGILYEKVEDKKEMTISEIEEELGYSIKIVKED